MRKAILSLSVALLMSVYAYAQTPAEYNTLMQQSENYAAQGNIEKAIESAEKAKTTLVKAKQTGYKNDYVQVVNQLGYYYLSTNPKKGFECFKELAKVFSDAQSTNNYVDMLNTIAVQSINVGDKAQSLEYYCKLYDAIADAERIDAKAGNTWASASDAAVTLLNGSGTWTALDWDEYTFNYFLGFSRTILQLNEFDNASKVAQALLSATEAQEGESTNHCGDALAVISQSAMAASKYDEALKAELKRMEVLKSLEGTNDPQYKASVLQVSQLYGAIGNNDKKNEYLDLYNGASNARHRDKSSVEYLQEQLNYNMSISNYVQAVGFGEKIVQAMEKDGAKNSQNYQNALNQLAFCYSKTGNTKEELVCFNKVMDIHRQQGDSSSTQYLATLNNLATVYMHLHDQENELYYKIKIIDSYAAIEGISNPNSGRKYDDLMYMLRGIIQKENPVLQIKDKAVVLTNFVEGIRNRIGMDNANAILEELLQQLEETSGRNNREGVVLLKAIGINYLDNEQYSDAKRYLEAGELTAIQVHGAHSVEYSQVLIPLVHTCMLLNEYDNSLKYLRRLDAFFLKNGLEFTSEYFHTLTSFATVYYHKQMYDSMATTLDHALSIKKSMLKRDFGYMTEAQRFNDYKSNIEPLMSYFYVVGQMTNKTQHMGTSYDMELISKGLILSSSKEFNSFIRNCNDPEVLDLYARLNEYKRILKAESEKSASRRIPNYNDLKIETDNIEMQLVTKSADYADLAPSVDVTWRDVKKSLGKNDVAIEFIHSSDGKYMALVITSETKYPEAVQLFGTRELKKAVSMASITNSPLELKYYESTALYNEVWKKLEGYLTPGCNIYFAPKGILHQIAIEYAPMENGSLFFDNYNVYRISSTKNLTSKVRKKKPGAVDLFGGINYNFHYDGEELNYLAGSLKEVNGIDESLQNTKLTVETTTGDEATSAKFAEMSGRNVSVIHVATHGIFEDSDGNSLDNSGLAMSDQILTSAKIAEMDLSSANLVVLSACETAKGQISTEGVFGLQRAFKLAGCKSLVMSLWPVNDYATQLMMTSFYTNMYELKMSERDAFNKAILELRAKKGTTPWHWAAFIMLD